jgi:hypothetical protein
MDDHASREDDAGQPAAYTAANERRRATLHLTAQATVDFTADQLWPLHGDYARFGVDLASFAQEVSRRLRTDAYVGYRLDAGRITLIPANSIKRIDFSERQ